MEQESLQFYQDGSAADVLTRYEFFNKEKDSLINLHKPHPSDILKIYLIKQIQMRLKDL